MPSSISTDIVRRIYDDTNGDGSYIEVGPGGDGFGVYIKTVNVGTHPYWPPIDITLGDKEAVRALARALLSAADESD